VQHCVVCECVMAVEQVSGVNVVPTPPVSLCLAFYCVYYPYMPFKVTITHPQPIEVRFTEICCYYIDKTMFVLSNVLSSKAAKSCKYKLKLFSTMLTGNICSLTLKSKLDGSMQGSGLCSQE